MDSLKAAIEAKRKAAKEEFGGKKFVKRSQLEELRLKRVREEEAREQQGKVRTRQYTWNGIAAFRLGWEGARRCGLRTSGAHSWGTLVCPSRWGRSVLHVAMFGQLSQPSDEPPVYMCECRHRNCGGPAQTTVGAPTAAPPRAEARCRMGR